MIGRRWLGPVLVAGLLLGCTASGNSLERAFSAVERGDYGPVSEWAESGELTVSALAPFLSHPDERVRREAVGLLNRLGEPAACEWLVGAMNDDSADIRERAARGAYQVCDESLLPPSLADALTEGLGRSNRAAAAILLAGRFSGDRILDALLARADDDPAVKLHNWSAPVPASLPAAVALLRLGHEPAEQRLLDTVSNGELGQQVFLLQVLDEIQDADLLRALAGLLSDRREIDGGVPSGATPRRRLCDLAVDAFAARFDLDLPFALAPSGRYSDGQIEEARQRIESRLGSR